MALEAAFSDLRARLEQLSSQLVDQLLWVINEGQPHASGLSDLLPPVESNHYLVGAIGDQATELASMVAEARQAIGELAPGQLQLAPAARSLGQCHKRFNQASHLLWCDLSSYERMNELLDFGRERGNAWNDWAENVKIELDRCQQPLLDVSQSLLTCWQEIAERIGATSVFLENTSIGQQNIHIPAPGVTA